MADDRRSGPGGPGQPGGYNYGQSGPGYRYDYGRGGSQPPKKPRNSNGWGEWFIMGFLFLLPTAFTKIIAIIWFIRKLSASDQVQTAYKQQARSAANQVKDAFTEMGRDIAGMGRDIAQEFKNSRSAQPQAEPPKRAAFDRREAMKKAQKSGTDSKGMLIAGGIMAGTGSIASIAMLDELISWFTFEDLAGLLLLLIITAGGVGLLLGGLGKRRRAERMVNYLGYIGTNREVPLANMAAAFGVSVEKLCKDLRYMLSKGILPVGYLDLAEGKLFLTEAGYRQPEQKAQPQPRPDPTPEEKEDDILRQIREVNDQIPDAAMSAKIDRIEEITGKILAYQKAHPDKAGQLRSFLNYYLPTTLKILRAYAQLEAQGIEGENISNAKTRIEGMMDQVVAGFEKQLDKLFRDDAMDITSDVEVLENMLKKDGLSDDGMTMPM